MLRDAVDHKLAESTAPEVLVLLRDTWGLSWENLTLGAGIIWKLLYSQAQLLGEDDLSAHSAGTVTWSIYI